MLKDFGTYYVGDPVDAKAIQNSADTGYVAGDLTTTSVVKML